MIKAACAIVLGGGLFWAASISPALALQKEDAENGLWEVLHRYEQQAIHDYEHHLFNPEVRKRAEQLWDLSHSEPFQATRDSCGAAAKALSYMVSGYYESRVRRELALDWHGYAKQYLAHRSACLAELKLDEGRYPLPWWFGR